MGSQEITATHTHIHTHTDTYILCHIAYWGINKEKWIRKNDVARIYGDGEDEIFIPLPQPYIAVSTACDGHNTRWEDIDKEQILIRIKRTYSLFHYMSMSVPVCVCVCVCLFGSNGKISLHSTSVSIRRYSRTVGTFSISNFCVHFMNRALYSNHFYTQKPYIHI